MNSHFTLYLDESGDFSTKSRPWIVGGILIGNSFKEAEAIMDKVFRDFIREYGFNTIEDFHLTEIRERYDNDHTKVSEFIKDFFSALDGLNTPYCFITTNNRTKVSSKEPERTYRLMVLDLILQAETAVVEFFNTDIEKLDLVIATRTINGVKQTTSGEIYQEILQSLPKGLESDLVATGQLALLGSNLSLYTENAKRFWGLINADFICNLTYNQIHEESRELLAKLGSAKKLQAYDTFSSPELRKVMSQEHNQNYSSAVFNCLKLLDRAPKNKDYQQALIRILDNALNKSGNTGAIINFDSVLERIWRSKNIYGDYNSKIILLKLLKGYLSQLNQVSAIRKISPIEFKLNNLMLLAYNHTAEVDAAWEIIAEQEVATRNLVSNPEYFSILLDFYVREIEILVNSLDFESAEVKAYKHFNLISEYQSIWELISLELTSRGFLSSDVSFRAKSVLLRALLLNYDISKEQEVSSLINELKTYVKNSQDLSRIHCQEIVFLMKRSMLDDALDIASKKISIEQDKCTVFDYYFFMFILNQNILLKENSERSKILVNNEKLVEYIVEKYENYRNYPFYLILRELSLFYHFKGEKKKSLELIKKSNNNNLNSNSKVSIFLNTVNEVQLDLIQNKQCSKKEYINKYKVIDGFEAALELATDENMFYNLRCFFVS